MDTEDDQQSIRSANYQDVVVSLRVFADMIPTDIVTAIIRSDLDGVAYKVDDVEYHLVVTDVSFLDSITLN
jgi:hypothetical protein|tara:strand:+ start:156 stop:368 length:213 start_codon:yes stop_codon:yes gene_type:complete